MLIIIWDWVFVDNISVKRSLPCNVVREWEHKRTLGMALVKVVDRPRTKLGCLSVEACFVRFRSLSEVTDRTAASLLCFQLATLTFSKQIVQSSYEIIIVVYTPFVWEIGRYLDLYYLLSELDVSTTSFLNATIEENTTNKIVKWRTNALCLIAGSRF